LLLAFKVDSLDNIETKYKSFLIDWQLSFWNPAQIMGMAIFYSRKHRISLPWHFLLIFSTYVFHAEENFFFHTTKFQPYKRLLTFTVNYSKMGSCVCPKLINWIPPKLEELGWVLYLICGASRRKVDNVLRSIRYGNRLFFTTILLNSQKSEELKQDWIYISHFLIGNISGTINWSFELDVAWIC
jgi:hypothetical protein